METENDKTRWLPKFKLDEEVTVDGSSIIRVIRKITRKNDGTMNYTLDNGLTYSEDRLRRVHKPYPNTVHFLIGDKAECVYGLWTEGEVIGYDQDVYLYVKVGSETKHCHFMDIKPQHERQPDLSSVLKSYLLRTFYSPLLGEVTLIKVDEALHFKYLNSEFITTLMGTDADGNVVVFPSKEQRDWNAWLKSIRPSTWAEIRETITPKSAYKEEFDRIDNISGDMSEGAMAFQKLKFLLKYAYARNDEHQEHQVKRFLKYDKNRLLLKQIIEHED